MYGFMEDNGGFGIPNKNTKKMYITLLLIPASFTFTVAALSIISREELERK